jgi:hypothetical protein
MGGISSIVISGKQIVLLAVEGLLSVSGVIAIGILLLGSRRAKCRKRCNVAKAIAPTVARRPAQR